MGNPNDAAAFRASTVAAHGRPPARRVTPARPCLAARAPGSRLSPTRCRGGPRRHPEGPRHSRWKPPPPSQGRPVDHGQVGRAGALRLGIFEQTQQGDASTSFNSARSSRGIGARRRFITRRSPLWRGRRFMVTAASFRDDRWPLNPESRRLARRSSAPPRRSPRKRLHDPGPSTQVRTTTAKGRTPATTAQSRGARRNRAVPGRRRQPGSR